MSLEKNTTKQRLKILSQKISELKSEYEATLQYGREWQDTLTASASIGSYSCSFFNAYHPDADDVMAIIKQRACLKEQITRLENKRRGLTNDSQQKTSLLEQLSRRFKAL